MGYTTDFSGSFNLDKPLTEPHKNYLLKFSETRRMRWDSKKTELIKDPIRKAVGLPVGLQGEYFVGARGYYGQGPDRAVDDFNRPPKSQPGLWCQWVPTETGYGIEWNGTEKFYEYDKWLAYLIEHFLEPWGYMLNGEVKWFGEDPDDVGLLVVEDNMVSVKHGKIVYE